MTRSRRSILGGVAGAGVALLAGCASDEGAQTESEADPTESETARATATDTLTPTEDEPTATILYDGGPVTLDGRDASVELRYRTAGGTVASTDFSTIDQPSGSGAGILEYDDYAEVQFDTRGAYVIQLTVTFEDGRRARDTVDITVE